jgi:hypothetical protein
LVLIGGGVVKGTGVVLEIFELTQQDFKRFEIKMLRGIVEVELACARQLKLLLLGQQKIKDVSCLLVFVGGATDELSVFDRKQNKM